MAKTIKSTTKKVVKKTVPKKVTVKKTTVSKTKQKTTFPVKVEPKVEPLLQVEKTADDILTDLHLNPYRYSAWEVTSYFPLDYLKNLMVIRYNDKLMDTHHEDLIKGHFFTIVFLRFQNLFKNWLHDIGNPEIESDDFLLINHLTKKYESHLNTITKEEVWNIYDNENYLHSKNFMTLIND